MAYDRVVLIIHIRIYLPVISQPEDNTLTVLSLTIEARRHQFTNLLIATITRILQIVFHLIRYQCPVGVELRNRVEIETGQSLIVLIDSI